MLSTNSEVGMCSLLEICVKLNCIVGWFWCLFSLVWCFFGCLGFLLSLGIFGLFGCFFPLLVGCWFGLVGLFLLGGEFGFFCLHLYFTNTENASTKGSCWGKRQNVNNTHCSTLAPVLGVTVYSCPV